MILLILVLFITSRVNSASQYMQYRMHVSRKSRSNSAPTETGYVYSQVNNHPGTFATFSDEPSGYKHLDLGATAHVEPYVSKNSDFTTMKTDSAHSVHHSDMSTDPTRKYNGIKHKYSDKLANYNNLSFEKDGDHSRNYQPPTIKYSDLEEYGDKFTLSMNSPQTQQDAPSHLLLPFKYVDTSGIEPEITSTVPSFAQYSINYAAAKAESKQGLNVLPSHLHSDAMYERLKSLMHYRPPLDMGNQFDYGTMNDFYADNDDVRTSSRSTYYNWPYFFHSPYEYEHRKIDSNIQKAKDKRFAIDTIHRVIPVHEQENDDPNAYNSPVTSTEYPYEMTTRDNPIAGHQPFFSFVLNDYFDRSGTNNDDPLTFKGLEWGKDYESSYSNSDYESDNDDYGKRNRRLQGANYPSIISTTNYENLKASNGESATEKGYTKKHQFDNHERGNDQKSSHESEYKKDGNNYAGFKDFIDTFSNKFGSEDLKKDSKYTLKHGQDKGEKRKGFRRVYHKDEYQEDNEFYDNSNKSAKGEEKGSSSIHTGGSGARLESHAAAALGNESNVYNDTGKTKNKNFENNHTGRSKKKGFEIDFNRYRDVAKQAARSNAADYTDDFK